MSCDSSGTIQSHLASLEGLCRICGERAKKQKEKTVPKLCVDYTSDILQVYRLNVSTDNVNLHPPKICNRCYLMMKKSLRTQDVRVFENSYQRLVTSSFWSPHSDDNCQVCTHFTQQNIGGKPIKERWIRKRNEQDNFDLSMSFHPPEFSTPKKQKISTADAQTSPFQIEAGPRCNVVTQCSPVQQNTTTTHVANKPQTSDFQTSPVKQLQSESIHDLLAKQPEEPLSNLEEKLSTSLVRRKQNLSEDKDIVTLQTGGFPITYLRIPRSRKPNSASMKAKRSQIMEKARKIMTGATETALIAQHQAEIRRLSSTVKARLQETSFSKKTVVNRKVGLALKSVGGLSITQFRAQKRLLKQACNIVFAGEEAIRKEEKDMQTPIHIENHNLYFTCEETISNTTLKSTPCVYVTDLTQFVTDILDNFDDQQLLTWHDNIPTDEIWVKVGGDHGGGSFKLSLQIANVQSPNSKHNTFMICMTHAKDSGYNIREILCTYRKQIDALKKVTWKGKQVRVFMFGDYDFLGNVYGLSGAAGTYPCLWCYTNKSNMQKSHKGQPHIQNRYRRGIKRDYRAYKRDGKDKKKAAKHHNVIRGPVFQIELDHVCPPYLHIVLGIVKKHHSLLEDKCHELDEKIAQHLAKQNNTDTDAETHFGKHVMNLKNKQTSTLKYRSGPTCTALDSALKTHKIDVQSFHGRSFTGNHCNKYLKDTIYPKICSTPVTTAQSLAADSDSIITQAEVICQTFEELNRLFSVVHNHISHDLPVAPSSFAQIEREIDSYMTFVRRNFPQTPIFLKQHLLEKHCVEWIKKWRFGMSLMGEQGGEQLHASINALKRRSWAIRRKEDQLQFTMKQHHLQVLLTPVLKQFLSARKQKQV